MQSAPLLGMPHPIHLMIREGQHHQYAYDVCFHRVSGAPPVRGFVQITNEVFVTTPEYAFVQIASKTPMTRLITIAYELCGTYATYPWKGEDATVFKCERLTNPVRLRHFVETHPGMTGGKKARRAAKLALAGSASPMETVLVLLLCLPVRMGGYGLPWPELNKLVLVDDGNGMVHPRYCDLCWPGYALEYEGSQYHAQPAKQVADSARRMELGMAHLDVGTVFRAQIEDPVAFERIARVAARHIGWRLRPEALGVSQARLSLRHELLGG